MISKSQFDEEVQNILDRLIRLYKPQKVILFGALARGEIKQTSHLLSLLL